MYPYADFTAVDIDSAMIDIAKTYFGLKKSKRITFLVADARKFVTEKHKVKFDLAIVDVPF